MVKSVLRQITERDETYENNLRPKTLHSFIGQKQEIKNLRVYLKAALLRGKPLDHTLLYGPPGLGKTTLAHIIAVEMGVGYRATSGPMLNRPGDLASILTKLTPMDVLFIDEIHRLPSKVEEVLYLALEDFVLDIVVGEGPMAQSVRIDLPQFTLIGATTRAGLMSRPLRDRFGIQIPFHFYDNEDLSIIIQNGAQKLGIQLTPDAMYLLTLSARGTPRIALRLLRRVVDFALVKNVSEVSKEFTLDVLQALGIDEKGLDRLDHRYIDVVQHTYSGGPVGIETLAAALSLERDVLEEVIEPYLIRLGIIQKTSRGRILTGSDKKNKTALHIPFPEK